MRKLTSSAAVLVGLALSTQVLSSSELYLETGIGASQYKSDLSASAINTAPASPSAKILIGSRLNSSPHAWFELMYNYNANTKYKDSVVSISSQLISTGVKLTTLQSASTSAFFRAGGGKIFISPNEGESISANQYYLGGGMSYRFTAKRAVNVEYQYFIVPNVDADNNDTNPGTYSINSSAVFLTLKQDID
jgi:opacity protein-like surface antigen